MISWKLLFCCLGLFCLSCSPKVSAPLQPAEMNPDLIPISQIYLPIKLPGSELNKLCTELLNANFKEGFTIDNRYRVQLQIEKPVEIAVSGNEILWKIPLNLSIKPNSGFQQLEAKGMIEFEMKSSIDIFNEKFLCKTSLINHSWIQKPVLKIFGLSIPIERISNQILSRYKSVICKTIDDQVMERISIDQLKIQLQRFFEGPFYSSDDSSIHVFSSPLEIALGPFSMEDDKLMLPVLIYIENTMSEVRPAALNHVLSFSIRPQLEQRSLFSIQSRIPINYIEQILRESLLTQEFGNALMHLRIREIKLGGQESLMQLWFETDGGFRGGFEMQFKPEFEESTRNIVLKEFHMKMVSGKKLSKSMFSLVHHKIESTCKKSIEQSLNDFVKEYLQTAQKFLQQNEIQAGMILNGQIGDYRIKNFWLASGRMFFTVEALLNLDLNIQKIELTRG